MAETLCGWCGYPMDKGSRAHIATDEIMCCEDCTDALMRNDFEEVKKRYQLATAAERMRRN